MNNINALLFSTGVTNIPISAQQGQLNIQSITNFQELVNNLLKKENAVEISNILNEINSNPQIMKNIYEAITALNLYGQLNDIASLTTNELENNQIINYVLNNNNLASEEKQIVLNSIKIISEQIIKNVDNTYTSVNSVNSVNYENINHQLNLITQEENLPINNIQINSDSKNIIINSAVDNNILNQVTDSNSNNNQNTQKIQILPSLDNSAKTVNTGYVSNPVINKLSDAPKIITNTLQKVDIIGDNLKITNPDINIKLENLLKIKNQVSDILNLFSDISIDKNNKTLQDEIINLKNYIKELDNILNQSASLNLNDSEQIKNISAEISRIVTLIFISMINAASHLYNYQIYNNEDEQQNAINPIGQFIKNNNYINAQVAQNNNNIYVAQNENNDLIKELLNKIFLMLKEMNGELYIGKKIEYVYKPFSSQTSQITPDGILLINTANLKNFKEFIDIYFSQIIDNKTPINISSIPGNTNSTEQSILTVNNINNLDTIKSVILNPVSVTHNYDIPKTFQITKDSINQSIVNTLNRNSNTNLKSTVDEINTYFVNFIVNKDEQKPVDAKIFEKIVDFSGRVRDDIVLKQIVKNISEAVKYKISEKIEVKMMLRPENLGPVIIKFETKDNIINGRIDVATTLTRDILKANIIELKNSLNNLGYNVENFEVSMLNAYTSANSNGNLNYYNRQEQQLPIHINNEIIEDIGVIAGTDSYLNYLA
ncbi:MAG: flagellar hook-length control protein FliK [Candidatus Goldbacteria bacterium]|nr:flagellar hook-length control protein FliK [Candidatus Goldiibacteriota bacterium]